MIVTLVIVCAALAAAALVTLVIGPWFMGVSLSDYGEEYDSLSSTILMAVAAPAAGGLIWLAAGLLGDRPREVLQIDAPLPPVKDVLGALAGYTLIYSMFVTFRYVYEADVLISAFRKDNEFYLAILRESYWPLVILTLPALVLASELLFQGFLLSGVAKWHWGFWGLVVIVGTALSAAVATSVAGAVQDFVLMVYPCWLTWRSGRLWLAIICELSQSTVLLAILAVGAWA